MRSQFGRKRDGRRNAWVPNWRTVNGELSKRRRFKSYFIFFGPPLEGKSREVFVTGGPFGQEGVLGNVVVIINPNYF